MPGIEVFGGIDLNLTVGGINPAAVEHMTKVTGGWGRVVWFPTFDSENQVRSSKENRPFVSVSRNGALLPAVVEVIAPDREAQPRAGHGPFIRGRRADAAARRPAAGRAAHGRDHAMNAPIAMTVAQMKEAATLGAFIEFVGSTPVSPDAGERYDRFAAAIRQIGPQFCILSSDLGQATNPRPAEGFGAFLVAMQARGFTAQDIDQMSQAEPGAPARSALTYASRLVDRSVASVRIARPHAEQRQRPAARARPSRRLSGRCRAG